MDMVFKFAEGCRLKGNPQVVGQTLHQIHEKHKRLDARDVVTEAQSKKSPLRDYFEWDDHKAASEHRINQARHLIRSVVILGMAGTGDIAPVRAFARVMVGDENSYEPISVVMQSPQMRLKLLQELQLEIERLKEKISAMQGLAEALAALNQVDVLVTQKISAQKKELASV